MRWILCLVCCIAIAGCSRNRDEKPAASDGGKSATRKVIGDLTGESAMRAGREAKDQINQAARQRNEDLEKVLKE